MAKQKATTKRSPKKQSKTVQKQQSVTKQRTWAQHLLTAAILFLVAYGFASWAIDTGSLWLYFFCFVSLYYGFDFMRRFLVTVKNNGKTR